MAATRSTKPESSAICEAATAFEEAPDEAPARHHHRGLFAKAGDDALLQQVTMDDAAVGARAVGHGLF
jgi:hypothetical protein